MRRAAGCLHRAGNAAAAAALASSTPASTTASGSSLRSSSKSLLASLASAASRSCLSSAAAAAVQRGASSSAGAASCSARMLHASSAAAVLAGSRHGLHTAAAPCWPPLGGLLGLRRGCAASRPRAQLRARYSTRADAAAAAAVLPVSWAAGGGLPSRWAAARQQLAARVEWVLGRGYHAREAFFNAVYMQVGGGAALARYQHPAVGRVPTGAPVGPV